MFKKIYVGIFTLCIALLGFALFIQHIGWEGEFYNPCPLCILQRVAYLGVAISCLAAYFSDVLKRFFHSLACLFSLFGLSVVFRHIWVIYHPTISCGLDPLEVWINQWAIVRWFDWLLKADGLCSAPLPPILGLTVPFWSFVWLTFLVTTLLSTLINPINKKLV